MKERRALKRRGAAAKKVSAGNGLSLPSEVSRLIIRDFITNGRISAGSLLPSEGQLCEIYGVSRSTVRSAVKSLHEMGLITVRNGVGAIVLPRAHEIPHGLDRLASIDTFAIETGHEIQTTDLCWSIETAGADVSRKLRVPVGDEVISVSRRKMVDADPAAWIIDYLPLGLIELPELKRRFSGSVLDVLLQDQSLGIEYADSEVEPQICDFDLAKLLGRPVGSAIMYLDSVVFNATGRPMIWGRVWLDPSHFRFAFRRRRIG